jgi:hypothetical protein
MWLDEIEELRLKTRRWATMPEDMDRMARVIREESKALAKLRECLFSGPYPEDARIWQLIEPILSDDTRIIIEESFK